LLASQALSRDLLCGDNDLLSRIANFYARCLFRPRASGSWNIWRSAINGDRTPRVLPSGRRNFWSDTSLLRHGHGIGFGSWPRHWPVDGVCARVWGAQFHFLSAASTRAAAAAYAGVTREAAMATFAKSWHRSRKVTLACAVVRVGALMGVVS
jgi:hypothetical protein